MNTAMNHSKPAAKRYESGVRAKALQPSLEMVALMTQVQSLRETVSQLASIAGAVATKIVPPLSDSLIGRRFFARVSGESIEVEVIASVEGPRPYQLRRVDTGRVLRRLRSGAALHNEPGPWDVPQTKRASSPPKAR